MKRAGANILRGGAFKPRTSPYAFQGMGEDGLKILARVREETHTHGTRQGMLRGLAVTGGVITSAGRMVFTRML